MNGIQKRVRALPAATRLRKLMRHSPKRTASALAILSLLLLPVFGRQRFAALSGDVFLREAARAACAADTDEGTEMARVPGATFEMGTEQSEVTNLMLAFGVKRADVFASEAPRHAVTLDDRESTGAAVVLAEQGKIKLDAPIGVYAKGLAPRLPRLTMHELLSNSAGVADLAAPFAGSCRSHNDADRIVSFSEPPTCAGVGVCRAPRASVTNAFGSRPRGTSRSGPDTPNRTPGRNPSHRERDH